MSAPQSKRVCFECAVLSSDTAKNQEAQHKVPCVPVDAQKEAGGSNVGLKG
jgi:hypothetical protein